MLELLKQGGVVMYPLGLCSLLTVGILLERLWHFARADRDPREVLARSREAAAKAGNPKPRWQDAPAPAERVVGAALEMQGSPRHAIEDHVQVAVAEENLRLGKHLGNIAPFVGLFGTVLGIIRAFRDIGRVGAAGPAVVAAGISEALIATAAGLFVAISAVIVYNLFVIWQGRLMRRAEIVAAEVLNIVAPGA